ncbi:bidirectional sugar transporter SWEET6a-like isoform X2 [Apium graveolens]|uniref:bidirectional sugar transporter SWEET6a-like isoform X2 n=1 Tax=Apium graveolens TaxID=4045 RepID=UPI003D7B88A4
MADTEIFRTVLGIIGNVISFGLFVLAVPTFYRILKNKSVKGVRPEYHLAMMMNCFCWALYGMPFINPRSIFVLTAYSIGLAIQLPYLIIILLYVNNNKKRMYIGGAFLIELVVISLAIGSAIRLVPTMESKKKLVEGEIVTTGSVWSVECVHFGSLLGRTLYALCWTIYACLQFKSDPILLSMNLLGVLWGVFQLKLYDVYNKSSARSGAADKKLATADVQVQGMGTA